MQANLLTLVLLGLVAASSALLNPINPFDTNPHSWLLRDIHGNLPIEGDDADATDYNPPHPHSSNNVYHSPTYLYKDSGTVQLSNYGSNQDWTWIVQVNGDSAISYRFDTYTTFSQDSLEIYAGYAGAGQPSHQYQGSSMPGPSCTSGNMGTIKFHSGSTFKTSFHGFSLQYHTVPRMCCVNGFEMPGCAGVAHQSSSNMAMMGAMYMLIYIVFIALDIVAIVMVVRMRKQQKKAEKEGHPIYTSADWASSGCCWAVVLGFVFLGGAFPFVIFGLAFLQHQMRRKLKKRHGSVMNPSAPTPNTNMTSYMAPQMHMQPQMQMQPQMPMQMGNMVNQPNHGALAMYPNLPMVHAEGGGMQRTVCMSTAMGGGAVNASGQAANNMMAQPMQMMHHQPMMMQ